MQFRSTGFIPLLTTLAMGVLFLLKFSREAQQTDYALKIRELVDESQYISGEDWELRRANYFSALMLLRDAQEDKVDLEIVLELAVGEIDLPEPYRPMLAATLQQNLSIAEEYGLLTEENHELVEDGKLPVIAAGGFEGESAVFDNLVPFRYSPELEMRYANLMLKPQSVVEYYPDRLEKGAVLVLAACRSSDLLSRESYDRTLEAVQLTGKGL